MPDPKKTDPKKTDPKKTPEPARPKPGATTKPPEKPGATPASKQPSAKPIKRR